MKGFGINNHPKKRKKYQLQSQNEYFQILRKAINYQSNGNTSQASRLYEFLIEKGFKESMVYANYGFNLINTGRLQEGELLINKAIELNPKDAILHFNLGSILKDLGKLKKAEFSVRKAIQLKPDFANAYLNLGSILSDLGKLEEAKISYLKAIELKPNSSEAHYNLAVILRNLGKLEEAKISYLKAIELKPNSSEAHYNLGNLLKNLGKLEEAKISYLKAIELNSSFSEAYYNLGVIMQDLGKLEEAEKSYLKAIVINPDYSKAYYSLSLIKYSDKNKNWQKKLLSENILINKSKREKVYIFFARANILHKKKNYKESSISLQLANSIKLDLYPSNSDAFIKKAKTLLTRSNKNNLYAKENKSFSENIFIVGMPRSGSTLVESILSMRKDVYDLGESAILEEAFLESENSKKNVNLAALYRKKVNLKTEAKITTNKNLYNYIYTSIIINQIPNSKIIYCFRNPLDNILSIYQANFNKGNEYASSLPDCAKIYIEHDKLMKEYKSKFKTKIYELNYDFLVCNPTKEIKSLIEWLGWVWSDIYLSPHLNPRVVSTASNVQVRSPINAKSIGGWKNYKDMLKPAMEILISTENYKYLKY